MCFSMYEMSSFRFILLVDGHSRFLITAAFLRKSFTECFADCLPVNPAGPVFGRTGAFFVGPDLGRTGACLGGIVFVYTMTYYLSPVGVREHHAQHLKGYIRSGAQRRVYLSISIVRVADCGPGRLPCLYKSRRNRWHKLL